MIKKSYSFKPYFLFCWFVYKFKTFIIIKQSAAFYRMDDLLVNSIKLLILTLTYKNTSILKRLCNFTGITSERSTFLIDALNFNESITKLTVT